MSLRCFQSILVRLSTDAVFREKVRSAGVMALEGSELTNRERMRLLQIVVDPGLDVTATLISSFRLGKVLSLLPLTRVLLGEKRLGREVRLFWQKHPPKSFYALEEVLAFCEYLQRRLQTGLRVAYLREILSLEQVLLELREIRPGSGTTTRELRFLHDPKQLLPCLASGQRPHGVRVQPCLIVATAEQNGDIHWSPGPHQNHLRQDSSSQSGNL